VASPHDALSLEDRPVPQPVRPLRDAFHLPALDASVAVARRRVLDLLGTWQVNEDCCSDAQLLVSELVTNAVRHTGSQKIGCEVRLTAGRLRVEVTDQGGGARPFPPPVDGTPDMDGENGRGLLLVSVLADEWGIRTDGPDDSPERGHTVWVELPCPSAGPG
jgi:serine/threonine-protein kinase RsbW